MIQTIVNFFRATENSLARFRVDWNLLTLETTVLDLVVTGTTATGFVIFPLYNHIEFQ